MIDFDLESITMKPGDILPIDSSVCTNFVKLPLSSNMVSVSHSDLYTIVEWEDGTTTLVTNDELKLSATDVAIFKKYQDFIKGA